MAEMVDLEKELIERTLELLKNNKGNEKYEFTTLLNALLTVSTVFIEKQSKEYEKEAEIYIMDCCKKLEELRNKNLFVNLHKEKFFHNLRKSIGNLDIVIDPETQDITLNSYDNLLKFVLKVTLTQENFKAFVEYVVEENLQRFCK